MSKKLGKKLAHATGLTLNTSLIIIAIVLICIVIFSHNKFFKAAVLAYEIFP